MQPMRMLIAACVLMAVGASGAAAQRAALEVGRDSALLLQLDSGTLIVQTWDQDRVQVEVFAEGPARLDLRQRGRRVHGTVTGEMGHPIEADVEVRVPDWMPLEIEGRELDCDLEQPGSNVEVRVLGGDLMLQGGRGEVRIRSVHGAVTLRGTSGEIDVHATNGDIRIRDVEGNIVAESVHGDIRIEGALAHEAELVTTSGDVLYDGSIESRGNYLFSTHDGDVRLTVPPDVSALVEIETYYGDVSATGARLERALVEVRRDREYRLELGAAEARVRIRNFRGDVELYDLKSGHRKGR
jgi:hypothetical protein